MNKKDLLKKQLAAYGVEIFHNQRSEEEPKLIIEGSKDYVTIRTAAIIQGLDADKVFFNQVDDDRFEVEFS